MKTAQIEAILSGLRAEENLRELRKVPTELVNFASNDYLGLSTEIGFQQDFFAYLARKHEGEFIMSNPASRLMSGNIEAYAALEDSIAKLFQNGREALVLNSGYTINTGALPALTERGDLLLVDKLCHASIVDGLRLCSADFARFHHNDLGHLEELIRKNRDRYRNIWVVTESIFSMDGDLAQLQNIIDLKRRYDLQIYLDEAHSFGVHGSNGAGLAAELGLAAEVDVIASGLGKAACSSGGFLITNHATKRLMINKMRTLIFSTALPAINLLWSRFIVERFQDFEPRRAHLQRLTARFSEAQSQIVPLIVGDSVRAKNIAIRLQERGFFTTAIRPPTVPRGTERIRISLNAGLSEAQVDEFREAWRQIAENE